MRLKSALQNAVAARETRMSFDFAFDFRSLVINTGATGRIWWGLVLVGCGTSV